MRDTSIAANEAMENSKRTLQAMLLRLLRDEFYEDGRTCDELEQDTGLTHQTCSPRLSELSHKGLIYDSGERRKSRANVNVIVWKAREVDEHGNIKPLNDT